MCGSIQPLLTTLFGSRENNVKAKQGIWQIVCKSAAWVRNALQYTYSCIVQFLRTLEAQPVREQSGINVKGKVIPGLS
jgi:hypothetical protein